MINHLIHLWLAFCTGCFMLAGALFILSEASLRVL